MLLLNHRGAAFASVQLILIIEINIPFYYQAVVLIT